ncbi:NAD(P)H-hydrate dehydratase [Cognatiyoonia sp. IB215446]|uniref:NAD(P)H-hydrate dehydratase n=1 Tax=Cognatiyoonia sp. IB215446 TaxID=3097355 RepID=UPI002A13BCE0|nr:NAD(P)H-hydrate dehydratase [Cognatiyoonia sp. IB215446]MDX8349635.1 NAD(P)H-hydrate dehydratase [Cognatiyoonia sp. IB215446]
MTELLTAAQMRAIEQAAIESGEVTGLELMERAGQGVVEAIFEEWPELAEGSHRAVVLCGPGNNGGDGFVVARLLKEAGWAVEVFLYGDTEKLPPDARVNYDRWSEIGGIKKLEKNFRPTSCDIVVDAVFGTGFSRPFDENLGFALAGLAKVNLPFKVVAIDAPSGMCLDSGRPIGMSLRADLTVTFHRQKCGHYLGLGARDCGHVEIRDIGLNAPLFHSVEALISAINDKTSQEYRAMDRRASAKGASGKTVHLIEGFDPRRVHKTTFDTVSAKQPSHHKYSHGHALILSGGVGKGGAARLAAQGGLRVGAGAVTVGAPPAAMIENATQLNAIMLTAVKDADDLTGILEDDRVNALCIGPGLGLSEESAGLVEAGLMSGRAVVLDADALTLIGRDASLFAALHEECVLTPHAGEFARLFPDIAEKLDALATTGPAYSKVDATREATKRAGCVVLFKGPDTVIADLSGRCSINASVYERSAPWLATAGSGDVLAGFITGLLARGLQPMQAAETGAWLHTECALSFGPGLIAEDLPEELPNVFRKLGL